MQMDANNIITYLLIDNTKIQNKKLKIFSEEYFFTQQYNTMHQ